MKPMTAREFEAALKRLGFARSDAPNDKGQSAAARFFGAAPRTVRQWVEHGPPQPVAMMLRLMLRLRLKIDDVADMTESSDGKS